MGGISIAAGFFSFALFSLFGVVGLITVFVVKSIKDGNEVDETQRDFIYYAGFVQAVVFSFYAIVVAYILLFNRDCIHFFNLEGPYSCLSGNMKEEGSKYNKYFKVGV
jgi:hypothetical protein